MRLVTHVGHLQVWCIHPSIIIRPIDVDEARSSACSRSPGGFPRHLLRRVSCASPAGDQHCTCTPPARRRYQAKLSGPLLDRVDIHLTIRPMTGVRLLQKSQRQVGRGGRYRWLTWVTWGRCVGKYHAVPPDVESSRAHTDHTFVHKGNEKAPT
ncbi:ATP-binding protein [Jidongwangia harbinensis]|uniref:ATP-binding protein n=1 Tax=Jidongwangia harbinensis TaxID=2878561 RepID=UPI003558F46F